MSGTGEEVGGGGACPWDRTKSMHATPLAQPHPRDPKFSPPRYVCVMFLYSFNS